MSPEEKQQAFKSLYPQRGKAIIYISHKKLKKKEHKRVVRQALEITT